MVSEQAHEHNAHHLEHGNRMVAYGNGAGGAVEGERVVTCWCGCARGRGRVALRGRREGQWRHRALHLCLACFRGLLVLVVRLALDHVTRLSRQLLVYRSQRGYVPAKYQPQQLSHRSTSVELACDIGSIWSSFFGELARRVAGTAAVRLWWLEGWWASERVKLRAKSDDAVLVG